MSQYAIVAIGYNRPKSMERLLNALSRAEFYGDDVTLIISIDNSGKTEVEECAEKFEWLYGEKRIITYPERQGLRRHILHCGNYVSEFEAVAIFEDDVIPEIGFYGFMKEAVAFYKNDKNIAGISFYTHLWNVNVNMPFQPAYGESDVFFMQFAQSWGQIWIKEQWISFMEWYKENGEKFEAEEEIPKFVSDWPGTSWLKYHIKYCIKTNKYFVYPYQSLSSCFLDVGEHCKEKDTHLQVPMQTKLKTGYRFISLHSQNAIIYDAFFERRLNNELIAGIPTSEIVFDLYGSKSKKLMNKKYLISTKRLDYEVVKKYGMELVPHEENVFKEIEGNTIYLYDLQKFQKNKDGKSLDLQIFQYRMRLFSHVKILIKIIIQKIKKKVFN